MDAAGGPDEFLERYAVIVCSDHGQSHVEQVARLDAGDDLVTASNRAAMVYTDDPRGVAERFDAQPAAGIVLFLEDGRGGRAPRRRRGPRAARRGAGRSRACRGGACATRTPARCSSRPRPAGSSPTSPAATTSAAAATARSSGGLRGADAGVGSTSRRLDHRIKERARNFGLFPDGLERRRLMTGAVSPSCSRCPCGCTASLGRPVRRSSIEADRLLGSSSSAVTAPTASCRSVAGSARGDRGRLRARADRRARPRLLPAHSRRVADVGYDDPWVDDDGSLREARSAA